MYGIEKMNCNKELINVVFFEVGVNIKATIFCLNEPVITFNTGTKYEDRAIESVGKVMAEVFKPLMKDAIKRADFVIETDIRTANEELTETTEEVI